MRINYKDAKWLNAQFGRLTVRGVDERPGASTYWVCECKCGKIVSMPASKVARGERQSCGCGLVFRRHGLARDENGNLRELYQMWITMRSRCNNHFDKSFHLYGGAGIKICSKWEDYQKFHDWAMDQGYDPAEPRGTFRLQRLNDKGNFTPQNCIIERKIPHQ